MVAIFEFIRLHVCSTDKCVELCAKNDGIFSCVHKGAGG